MIKPAFRHNIYKILYYSYNYSNTESIDHIHIQDYLKQNKLGILRP